MKKIHSSLILVAATTLLLVGAGCSKQQTDTTVDSPTKTPPVAQGTIYPITFQPTGLTPKEITIKVGDIVEFRNSDLKPHWPASAPHPTHTAYPEFDSKAKVAPGEIWTFTFTKSGDWKFHDHLNANNSRFQGIIHVTEK